MDEFIQEFLIEGGELLDQLDRDFVEFEKNPNSKELVARIFRAVHTLKGTGGTIGLKKLESVNHVGESILSRMREGKLNVNAEITSALLRMIDVDRQLLAAVERTGEEGDMDLTEVIQSLTDILTAHDRVNKAASDEVQKTHAANLDLTGNILVQQQAVEPDAVANAVKSQCKDGPHRTDEILAASAEIQKQVVQDALPAQSESREDSISSNIRVDVNLLEKVMNLVGELVLARNQILQFTSTQKDPAFLNTAQRLNLITTELQEGVMKTRMQPIGNVWNKFPRIVRDLSNATGKSVRLEMEGSQTELDKTIIEAIKDPLTHIVRNSLDHGIEKPAEREAAGKPRQGLLFLRAFHEGGQVNIEISDDGAGLDLNAIKEKAIERGIVPSQQAANMSDRAIGNLIFMAGFSTAKQVTNISGRGVGMDVVRTNIEKIGGTVDVSSVRGRGTTLKIKIPLTLAIIPALIVTTGGERFAIPQVNLVELVRLEGKAAETGIESIQEASVYRLRGTLLPVIHLTRELKLARPVQGNHDSAINIVVLQADSRQFGLVVDGINDTEEIVVKPLSKQLRTVSCFAGATIMGDGKVALILDILGLAQRASLAGDSAGHRAEAKSGELVEEAEQRESWLLFRVGDRGKLAVPLSMVSRLEEFDSKSIERSGNRQVVQYRGEIMPLVSIADALQMANPAAREGSLQVVVHTAGGSSVGLIVDEILDIVDQHVSITREAENRHLLGSAVIQQHVTDLLNVPELISSITGNGGIA
ncbi:MAG TPA: chemotaxis protein CheW [Candidatus Saccharimonadales bacterium]|nr:chemotaxis protein CheW [Candidatus Saccharimonadales bacterium]